MITAQEAKKILLEQRKRARERQAEHIAKMREQGYRRIAVMISGEAYKALDKAVKERAITKGDLVSDIILDALMDKGLGENVSRGINISANVNVPRGTFDKEAALNRVLELSAEGLSHQQIAERLTAEGIPTMKGGPWNRGTVGKWLKQAKDGK